MNREEYLEKIFAISGEDDFNALSLEVFRFQYQSIAIYRKFVDFLKIRPQEITHYSKIPFLPISFFKSHTLIHDKKQTQTIFKSSGTTAQIRSQHYVQDLSVYEKSFTNGFTHFYGSAKEYCIIALLPSYLENGDSSLVYMADKLIKQSNHPASGFYLNDTTDHLVHQIEWLENKGQKTLLLGVSYALLDLVKKHSFRLKHTQVMETGGMKGRRKEMIREELHAELKKGFGVSQIHSEYGMTELLSQAYSTGNGIFKTPPWMKILIRDVNDPLSLLPKGQSGGINIIDLANLFSVAFIETKDLGKQHLLNNFEILGRFDDSDIRGCNLLIN